MSSEAPNKTPFASTGSRLPADRVELAGVVAITLAAAIVRLAYVPTGSSWGLDQGTEMLALWATLSTGQLPLFGPAATSLGSTFHHGALYYDLLLPAAWLSRGDPRAVVAEIALLNSAAIPMLWWIARSIGGRATGFIVALLTATSAGLVYFSVFIWNATIIEPAAALATLGAWQAWRTGRPAWWLVAAVGLGVAAQAHVAAAVLALPLGAAFVADLRRARGGRQRVLAWGLAGMSLIAFTYAPVIVHELSSGFTELHGMVSYLAMPPGYVSVGPLARLVFAAIRVSAWPLTGWPFYELTPGLPLAVLVTLLMALAAGILLLRAWRHGSTTSVEEIPGYADRAGVTFVFGSLAVVIVALGLGIRAVSELNITMTEQYHLVADPFVLLATGLALGSLWSARGRSGFRRLGQIAAVACVIGVVGWNVAHWPPIAASDGGWPAAQTAADRLEKDAAGTAIAVVALDKNVNPDAYSYPLIRDGHRLADPSLAGTVVLVCSSAAFPDDCSEERDWIATNANGPTLTLTDRFLAAPDRTASVYRRSP